MDVFVDDKPIADAASTATATIEDALRHAQTNWCAPGRLVVRFRCDGHDIVGEAMLNMLPRPASTIARLEVFTATKRSLVMDAMVESASSLRKTQEACQQTAELISEGNPREGVELLGDCMRAWQNIYQAVLKSVEMLGLDMHQTLVRGEPLEEVLAKPRAVLTQLRDALTAQDFVLLADVLQYEFKDVIDQWGAVISRLREETDGLPT